MFKITGDLISENLTCPPEMMGPFFKLSFTKSISSTSILSKKINLMPYSLLLLDIFLDMYIILLIIIYPGTFTSKAPETSFVYLNSKKLVFIKLLEHHPCPYYFEINISNIH